MNDYSKVTFVLLLSVLMFVSCKTVSVEKEIPNEPIVVKLSEDPHAVRPIPYPVERPWEYDYAQMRGTRSEDGSPGEMYWQQYATYDLKAEINPESRLLSGSMSATYFNNSPDDLPTIHLELAQNVHSEGATRLRNEEVTGGTQLHSVKINGQDVTENGSGKMTYFIDGTQLVIRLENPLLSGSSANVEIEWSFTIPKQGAGGRMGWDDGLFYLGYWYPHFSVYDDVYGWMMDTFTANAEFYHGFADYSMSISMPEDWVVYGTGKFLNPEETLATHVLDRYQQAHKTDEIIHVLTDEDFGTTATASSETGMHTWKFSAEKVTDVAFSATKRSYWDATRTEVGDLSGDGETEYALVNAFYREEAPLWKNVAEYSQHAIAFLSELSSLSYPWPHMTAVEGANIIGGGMEFPMMTIMGSYNGLGAWRLYSVTAHELAHMWMPMIVSTNERRYTWIDEGNTVFKTDHARKDFYPQMSQHGNTQSSYIAFAQTGREGELMRWSDFHYSQQAYGVASYPKPASILVALRGVLGDEVFWEAYKTFMHEWAYKHPYPWDMFRTYERVSGLDLSWFWRAWYYETWGLNQAVHNVEESDGKTIIHIRDYGDTPMPVLLRITFDDGEVLNERISHDVWLSGVRDTYLEIERTGVSKVEIDADQHFPDMERQLNTWTKNLD